MSTDPQRRRWLTSMGAVAAGVLGRPLVAGAAVPNQVTPQEGGAVLPPYARAQDYKTLKQSSYDRTGGNHDSWPIAPGGTHEVFSADGPGIITHIWYTIAAKGEHHLKELVMRVYWDGNSKPSVEVPVGDFFGLNLGDYFVYQSAFLNCSDVKALNCYFAMPFRKSARITITNEGPKQVDAFYSNIDYQLVKQLPADALYFHAQYRQASPNKAVAYASKDKEINLDGKDNYVFLEAKGRGQVMGVTMGVLQNADGWFGEGDDMTFIDDMTKPAMTGTGTEDYFNGAWDFGGRQGTPPFAHLYNGQPYTEIPEQTNGRYCLYRWHADNPIAFQTAVKHTIEHGHANDRGDNFFTVGYWYQTEPYTDFPALPPVAERIPVLKVTG
jgi:hypothetical protein